MHHTENPHQNWLVMSPVVGDARELQAACEARAAKRIEEGEYSRDNVHYVSKLQLNVCSEELSISDELLERLRLSCRVWNVDMRAKNITSHRPFLGPVLVAFKKALFPVIYFFLKDTLRQQRDFNASVIRCLTQIAQERKGEREAERKDT